MQIQVNSDNNVAGHEDLIRRVELDVEAALSRFSDQLTRVEVHLGDESAGTSSVADMRCTIEARPAGQQPVAVTHHAVTLDEACRGAAHKLQTLLERRFAKIRNRKGGASIRQEEER